MAPTWLTLLSIVGIARAVEFVPGCSFVGGQCMYTVQLGHQGQCDAQPALDSLTALYWGLVVDSLTTLYWGDSKRQFDNSILGMVAQVSSGSDSQCCVTVQNEVASLRTDVQSLKQEIPVLVNALNQTTSDLQTSRELAESLRGEKDSLLEMLHRLQTDLNNTQSQSANLLATAANEIRALRQDLTNMTAALHTCQVALGVVTGESVKPAVDIGPLSRIKWHADSGMPLMSRQPTDCRITSGMPLSVFYSGLMTAHQRHADVQKSVVSLSGDVQLSYCSFHVLEDCGYKRLVGGTSFYQLTKGSSSLSGPSVEHSTGIIT
ncbi:hypothetical protein Btru_030709, partial [Bulinus truncatus]